jgi:type III pantothenate kinase
MQLVVDIGNTKTKVAAFQNGEIVFYQELKNGLDSAMRATLKLLKPSAGLLSSVADGTEMWKETFPEIAWLELSRSLNLPVTLAYGTPETLGLDRIALAAAAATLYPNKNTLVIDAGTCVTYDVILANATFVGGAIAPGLVMRLKAMHAFTAKLPLVNANAAVDLLGKSTESCMQAGALYGLASEVEGFIDRYAAQFENLHTVITGGDANLLAPLVKNNIFAHPKFLLEGLHAILAYNTP